ncbi:MAG: cation-translocating P-type ATPase [Pseudomonadota bacterium]
MILTQKKEWHTLSLEEISRHFGCDLKQGFSEEKAVAILQRVGPNQLAEKSPPSFIRRLLIQVSDATVATLIVAASVAAITGALQGPTTPFLEAYGDAVAILAIVILNALLGLVQEKRAEKALSALKNMTSPQAHVIRNGQVMKIPAFEVIPGDILNLSEGDKIPADARLLWSTNLEATEAPLTGESFPVPKEVSISLPEKTPLAEQTNMVFTGTEITRGRARAVVVNTGMNTELGKIAGMLASMEVEETPLQRYLNRFGQQIVITCIVVSLVVFFAGMMQGIQTIRELFLTAVSLAVAAIPEGLPAITTIVLALGTQRMARRHALVRRLPAVEGLGSAQIICTDKTGTLTENIMTVRRIHVGKVDYEVGGDARDSTGSFYRDQKEMDPTQEKGLSLFLSLAAWSPDTVLIQKGDKLQITGNPTDGALCVAARKGRAGIGDHSQIEYEIPFSSVRKMATLVVKEGKQLKAVVRGAPEILLAKSNKIWTLEGVQPLTQEERTRLQELTVCWGEDAMRPVALAFREGEENITKNWESDLTFVGLAGIVDPPRVEVAQAIAKAKAAGIQTMMVTGDHPATAKAVAEKLNLFRKGESVLTGQELDMLNQEELENLVENLKIVARATPLHKLRIVEALKARNKICAMTGDGVNDAPAVKAASIGVAMGKAGTEVTKEAADLVLADDNYATIISAVEEGRAIFSNIKKFIFFLLSSNTGIVLAVFVASLLGWAPPLLPIQILWINLVTNGLPALALGVEPAEPDLMQRPPRDPTKSILGGREYSFMLLVGAIMAVGSLFVFALLVKEPTNPLSPNLRMAQTAAFAVLSISPMFHAFNCRSAWVSNFRLGWGNNRALWGAVLVGIVLIGIAVYIPALHSVFRTSFLPLGVLGLVTAVSATPLVLGELGKLAFPHLGHSKSK